jgi:hypothetical protein
MSDFDAARPKPAKAKMQQIIDELDAERAEALVAALNDLSYSVPTIKAVLNKWGIDVSTYPISEWRRKNV